MSTNESNAYDRRLFVYLQDGRVPLTPLDDCWACDGRVYVQFAQMSDQTPRLVGVLSDPARTGDIKLKILACHPDTVPVEVARL